MRPRLFSIASVLSLLLCLATVALWVRTYFASDSLYLTYHAQPYVRHVSVRRGKIVLYGTRQTTLMTGRGCVQIQMDDSSESETPVPRLAIEWGLSGPTGFEPLHSRFHLLGFDHAVDYSVNSESFTIPIWMFVVIFAVFPAWRESLALVHRQRRSTNHCVRCGYSLTGNTSGVCPECGTPTTQERSAISMGPQRSRTHRTR